MKPGNLVNVNNIKTVDEMIWGHQNRFSFY